MTSYELTRLLTQPFLPVLYSKVHRELRQLLKQTPHQIPQQPVSLLDVGGRKSAYTIGLPAAITVLDIPRTNEIQEHLNLGFNDEILREIQQYRSNIKQVVLQDMTQCTLPSASFDGVICVEVIEHIQDDTAFMKQIARVLKPGGWLYLTTPNGDYIPNELPNYNPDHVRHYTRQQLLDLLSQHFSSVAVTYGVKCGENRSRGLQGLSPRQPIKALGAMTANMLNRLESRDLAQQPRRTAHLFAVAYKS